ncbi:outer membrane protein assembly factor BamE [Novosphingobium umbonatum]|jgi:outer membrane protein assembly factor BamE (lipoprotein component of BamABCDE complex)
MQGDFGAMKVMRFKAGKLAGSGKKAASLSMLVAAVALSGCSTIRDHRGFLVDQALVDSVLPGVDNKISVERTLGRPTLASQFGDQAWYYISTDTKQVAFRRPQTNQQTILRVRFDAKGNVIAVDKAGMERVARLDPDKDLTPTLGKKRTLLEDLFGNIGTVGAGGMGGSGQGGGGQGGGPNGS